MNTKTRSFKATALALAVLGTLAAGQAAASGFQLREQSVKNLGKSNAGSTTGVSVMLPEATYAQQPYATGDAVQLSWTHAHALRTAA